MASAYTRAQIDQFLHHIGLPISLHHVPPSLTLLKALHTHMLSTCPYENLAMHYNPTHTVLLDPQHLFQKIVVDKRGRGGYCMENALLYNHILRGLGFVVYTAGVRTRSRDAHGVPGGDYPGWTHIVNLVTLPCGARYHVDVAFGGDGALMPLPLESGLVHANLGSQQIRLVRDWVSTQTHRTEASKLWIYQYRNGADREWNSYYCFTETEFMPLDWEVINWWTGSSERSHQTRNLLCILFLRRPKSTSGDGDGEQEIYGKRMMANGVVKENLGGKTQPLGVCKTEAERVEALEKHFGLTLTEEERLGIRGSATDLDAAQ